MEKTIKKLCDLCGDYFEAETPATIFGSSDGKVYIVYKPNRKELAGYVIAELNHIEYDFTNNTCNNKTSKQNIPFDQILTQTIKSGSINFHDYSQLTQSDNCEQFLYAFINSKLC